MDDETRAQDISPAPPSPGGGAHLDVGVRTDAEYTHLSTPSDAADYLGAPVVPDFEQPVYAATYPSEGGYDPSEGGYGPSEGGYGAPGPDVVPSTARDALDEPQLHRHFAALANNSVWDVLEQPQPWLADTLDDVLERAYAAAYHWRRAQGGGPAHKARAAWLIARVHAYAAAQSPGHADVAYHHASQCMGIVNAADLQDFDRAYAHEAVARAAAACGRLDNAADHRTRALAVPIAEPADAAQFRADLASGPWFGLPPLVTL